LKALARELADEVRVLCFDELFVNDIGDAIILGRLFQVMFEQGVVVVCTSNLPPDQLYADGFNRDRFLPAIAAIKQHMQVIAVDGGEDHRLHPGQGLQRYWVATPDNRVPWRCVQGVDRRSGGFQRSDSGWLPLAQCGPGQPGRRLVSLRRPL
jgi:cell division protein ZapE